MGIIIKNQVYALEYVDMTDSDNYGTMGVFDDLELARARLVEKKEVYDGFKFSLVTHDVWGY